MGPRAVRCFGGGAELRGRGQTAGLGRAGAGRATAPGGDGGGRGLAGFL